jgi:hypothetical protein
MMPPPSGCAILRSVGRGQHTVKTELERRQITGTSQALAVAALPGQRPTTQP